MTREIDRLGDLADAPTRELLELLASDAPGTLLHSVAVADIVEAVSSDPRDRRAALLHDIGKICAPDAFGENTNVRRGPRPEASLLRRHVVFGQQLARRYQLGERCLAAISEHHGTLALDGVVRYPGPPPQSALTAALMLADCYEAVSAQAALTTSRARQLLRLRAETGQFAALSADQLAEISRLIWQRVRELGLVRR